ncbi:MAG: hypothetical protein AABW73_00065 [Nanoarchaeota archaeon]
MRRREVREGLEVMIPGGVGGSYNETSNSFVSRRYGVVKPYQNNKLFDDKKRVRVDVDDEGVSRIILYDYKKIKRKVL